MRGQLVAGWFLLLNERAAIRWSKKHCLDTPARPLRYPCLVKEHVDHDEWSSATCLYLIDVNNMRDALLNNNRVTQAKSGQRNTVNVVVNSRTRKAVIYGKFDSISV
jgi:hypothetical protein